MKQATTARVTRRQLAAVGPPAVRVSRRELAAIALVLIALTAVILRLVNGGVLFNRPFWVDEWFTVLVASARSPLDVVAHLRHGADGGASLFHLVVWAIEAFTGSVSTVALRALSLVFVWGALFLIYATLRRRFTPEASLVGVLAVGSHGLVVAHAFEGRFYALWLLCCALVAWSLGLDGRSSRLKAIILAVGSVLLVTSHWYGIFTLALMCVAVVFAQGHKWRGTLRQLWPAIVGVLTFLAILPLAVGQRGAVTVDTWIPEFTVGQLRALAATFWMARVPLAAALVILAAWFFARTVGADSEVRAAAREAVAEPGNVALLSLAAMPLVLTALSLAGQPSMISRYAIPAVLAWGPLMAFAVTLMGRWPTRLIAIVLVGFWFVAFTREAGRKRAFAAGVAQERRAVLGAARTGVPVIFQSQHTMYPALGPDLIMKRGSNDRQRLVAFLELPDSTLDDLFPRGSRWYQLNKGIRLERDYARVHAARFRFPPLAPQAVLDTTPRFLFLASAARLPRGVSDVSALARATFPRHSVTQLSENLLLLERADARNLPGRSTSQ